MKKKRIRRRSGADDDSLFHRSAHPCRWISDRIGRRRHTQQPLNYRRPQEKKGGHASVKAAPNRSQKSKKKKDERLEREREMGGLTFE
jgi:hypothetical protein